MTNLNTSGKNHRSARDIKRINKRKPHRFVDAVEHKHCINCDSWKPLSSYTNHHKFWDGLDSYCKDCNQQRNRAYQKGHFDELKKRRAAYWAVYNISEHHRKVVATSYRRLKDTVIDGYGEKCSHCGFSDRRALQIDHVNGGGRRERGSEPATTIWRRIILENFPSSYQLLCANCNMIKMYENREFPGWKSFATTEAGGVS